MSVTTSFSPVSFTSAIQRINGRSNFTIKPAYHDRPEQVYMPSVSLSESRQQVWQWRPTDNRKIKRMVDDVLFYARVQDSCVYPIIRARFESAVNMLANRAEGPFMNLATIWFLPRYSKKTTFIAWSFPISLTISEPGGGKYVLQGYDFGRRVRPF